VSRANIATVAMDQRFTTYGKKDATLESFTYAVNISSTFWYDSLLRLREPNDPKLHFNTSASFKGGWRAGNSVSWSRSATTLACTRASTSSGPCRAAPRTRCLRGVHRITNLDISQSISTPQFSTFRGSFSVIWGWDENFEEWARAFIMFPRSYSPGTEPQDSHRSPLSTPALRPLTDWSTVKRRQIPRLKVEYQATRAVFLRFVGQYDAAFRDSLRDASRTEFPSS